MADVIRLLPDSVANQIAAGEVITRPAAVLKELVENAVDAGATEINIVVRDAGRSLLQVSDNGKGMSRTDVRMAFERHATSKIDRIEDLYTLRTMGFRGEALPSICAVAQVETLTSTSNTEMGTRLIINGSKMETCEPCNCLKGTTISVKNLFFNVPARRRFLKSDSVEMSNILREFERLALVNTGVRFTLDNGTRKRDLLATNFKQRIADLWKGNLNLEILPVNIDTGLVKINGYISRPEHARRRNALQYLIVNGRNMRHPYFHRGIVDCYSKLIAPQTQPCYFLKFEVDPSTIDVNIHPTKNEIKFEHESEIWGILVSGIRAALGKFSAVPSIDFDSEPLDIPPVDQTKATDYHPTAAMDNDYDPFAQTARPTEGFNPFATTGDNIKSPFLSGTPDNGGRRHATPGKVQRNWESLYAGFMNETEEKPAEADDALPLRHTPHEEVPALCVQVSRRYIAAPSNEGLMIIDQHRAHVKILYEQFMKNASTGQKALERVLFGEEMMLDDSQQAILADVEPELAKLGITLQPQGEKWVISAMPPQLTGKACRDVVYHILDSFNDDSHSYGEAVPDSDTVRKRVALVMARAGAIKRGQLLSTADMEHIVSELFRLPDSNMGPDGKTIMCLLKTDVLDGSFGY